MARDRRSADGPRETIITDLIDGQYSNPISVVAFNTAERSRHVSEDFAEEIAQRCTADGFDVPPFLD